ncbi:alpha/beta fold hydrolase [Dysgonomonas sp. Marseille-P4677]|uniref:alpha/beta hydrolase n=1 Tax=Dysgonomonas sp. Marseille-P4677 TaxID=2364790 RepID=UPI0019127851|nr:alpha/beta fold hydrolase [Dysgonomonas sp. Marseille-P4677]MBK5722853.1 alpha/beta fold hydrolase [Dysgonomonas sp. Marseille-P4677]
MKKAFIKVLIILSSIYIIFCVFFFFFQEKFIFYPEKLDKNYKFNFNQNFEEIDIKADDGTILNGLLFKTEKSKGLIFYLHGNAGALDSWGQIAPIYTALGYDIFFLDYRGFGKSQGSINSQSQLFSDTQTAYNEMKQRYDENKIIVLGFSIGTGMASKIAFENNPRLLILQAPYYSLTNVIQSICPIIPNLAVKYKLETYKYVSKCRIPIIIFHGDADNIIDYNNSMKLKTLLKRTDSLITLKGEGHNTITENDEYQKKISEILN